MVLVEMLDDEQVTAPIFQLIAMLVQPETSASAGRVQAATRRIVQVTDARMHLLYPQLHMFRSNTSAWRSACMLPVAMKSANMRWNKFPLSDAMIRKVTLWQCFFPSGVKASHFCTARAAMPLAIVSGGHSPNNMCGSSSQ